jgi:thymidylate synthase (FAD)
VHVVEPKVIVIAETRLCHEGIREMLTAIGAPSWEPGPSTNAEALSESAGRLCYKSFEVGLNPNVTRIREGNKEYILNLLKQKHGSVLEHASTSVALIGVSRILTLDVPSRKRACASFALMTSACIYLTSMKTLPN